MDIEPCHCTFDLAIAIALHDALLIEVIKGQRLLQSKNMFRLIITYECASDRFSAFRLGGVLPLAAEFPLALPGYYYQEISARRFVHMSAAYVLPLSRDHHWQLRLEAASAYVDYLPGFEQPGNWQTGVGPGLSYTSKSEVWRVVLRYGYAVNALRNGHEGGSSVGLLYQYNFERRKYRKQMAL